MPLCALNSCPQLFPQTKPDQTRPDQTKSTSSQAKIRLNLQTNTTLPYPVQVQNLTSSSSSPTSKPKPKVTIIDVREPGEVAQTGRIPGSLNVPMTSAPDSFHVSEDEFEDRFGFARPDPADGEVLFYCKAGVRSRAAAGIARDAGWTKVGEYPGSWLDWVGRGGKVER